MRIEVHLDQIELDGIDGLDPEQIRSALSAELARPSSGAASSRPEPAETPSQSVARGISAQVSAAIDQSLN